MVEQLTCYAYVVGEGRGKVNFCFSVVDNIVNLCRSIALGIEFTQQYILLRQ